MLLLQTSAKLEFLYETREQQDDKVMWSFVNLEHAVLFVVCVRAGEPGTHMCIPGSGAVRGA